MASAAGVVAILDTLTFPEMMTILVIALVILGPEKLPDMAKQAGVWLNKLKQMSGNLQEEMRDVIDDPAMQPIKELGEFAAQPRRKLAEYAAAAQAEAEEEAAAEIEAAATASGDEHPMNDQSPVQPGSDDDPDVNTDEVPSDEAGAESQPDSVTPAP
jgi:Tat protein translocase TatB subunit